MKFRKTSNQSDAPQKWFQRQERSSRILRFTFQNSSAKQALINSTEVIIFTDGEFPQICQLIVTFDLGQFDFLSKFLEVTFFWYFRG